MKEISNEIYSQINSRYNLSFLDNLKSVEGLAVYAFGGVIRDMVLKRDWKEADIRIVLNKERKERELIVEDVLASFDLQGKTQIESLNLTVYRFLPSGSSTNEPIDLSLVPTLEDNLPDFTINSIFYDLSKKEVIDRFGGVEDLDKKTIRTVKDPDVQFPDEPHMIFRAIKFACQLNFDLEDKTKDSIFKNAKEVQKTFKFISDFKSGIFVELFLGNIFKGLKSDPDKYFIYLKDLKLFDQFVIYVSEKFKKPIKEIIYPISLEKGFEENISNLFSCVVNSLETEESKIVFKVILEDFAIISKKEYSDFVIDINKISYYS